MVTKKKTKTSKKKSKSSKKTTGSTRKKTSKASGSVSRKASAKKKVSKKKTSKKKTTSRSAVAKKTSKKKVAKKAPARKKTSKKLSKKAVTKKAVTKKAVEKAPPKAAPPVEPPAPPKPKVPTIAEALAKLKFHEGDHVVHPKYGLGKVMALTERKLTDQVLPCLLIHFSHQDMRLTIPVDQVDRSGLRRPMSRKQADEVFETLRGRATFDAKRRSAKRVADYQKRVRLGDPHSLAEVVRDLSRLGLKKTLSYEERKIQSEALRILSREVALTRGRDVADVLEDIETIVNR